MNNIKGNVSFQQSLDGKNTTLELSLTGDNAETIIDGIIFTIPPIFG